jgi:hypothetical protein
MALEMPSKLRAGCPSGENLALHTLNGVQIHGLGCGWAASRPHLRAASTKGLVARINNYLMEHIQPSEFGRNVTPVAISAVI